MSLPSHMQAMAIHQGHLRATKLPLPELQAGEVLIRVAYVGINRADVMQLAGQYAPPPGASTLPGLEVSGWIASEAAGFTVGAPVCALLSGGGYAEYVAVPAGQILKLPRSIDLQQAAAVPESAATGMMALLHEGKLTAGERVLIHGGSSGGGLMLVQIAKALGAEVFTTVGSPEKAAFVEAFGARAIQYKMAPFGEQIMAATANQGIDLIIDTLGGPQVETHFRLLRRGGRMVTLAMLEGSEIPAGIKMTRLMMNHLHWCGATLRSRTHAEKAAFTQMVAEIVVPKLENGTIKPVIDRVFPLAEAEKALHRMQERLHMGKILLEVAAEIG